MIDKKLFNLPNALTLFRLCLIGVLIWLFMIKRPILALVVYIIASATDVLDGYIARKYDIVTNFGKLADPLADKLMLVATLVSFYRADMVSALILILATVKESVMIIGSFLLLKIKKRVVYSDRLGKIGTMLFFIAVVLTFFHDYLSSFDTYIMYIALAVSFVAMVRYIYKNAVRPAKGNWDIAK